jgi:hypothetical protein
MTGTVELFKGEAAQIFAWGNRREVADRLLVTGVLQLSHTELIKLKSIFRGTSGVVTR